MESNEQQSDSGSSDKEKKKEYQIGETEVTTSDMYDFDYEVTVNDFRLMKEVDGVKIGDYIGNADGKERFAVVDVTIKNVSDQSYVPNEMFSANLAAEGDRGGDVSEDDFFEVGDKELAPNKKLNGHLVYVVRLKDSKKYTLKYEFTSDEETHFELPSPEN